MNGALLKNLRLQRGGFEVRVDSLTLAPGTITGVLGASGSGKSSLLEALAGFVPLQAGEIWVQGQRIDGLVPERRRVALMFQRGSLFPHLNLEQNVAFGLAIGGMPVGERMALARGWLEKVGLGGMGARRASEVSEGQAQRVALARALAVQFPVLLLDEPFSALDENTKQALRPLVRELVSQENVSAILVSHDPQDIAAMASQVLVQSEGQVVWSGAVEEWKTRV